MYKYRVQKTRKYSLNYWVKRWFVTSKICRFESYYFRMGLKINQKFILLEIINKFYLSKIKSYNLRLQLKFKLNFNLKTISVHYLILKFFSVSKSIILKKSKSNTFGVLTQNYNKYTIKFLTKLNLETLLFTKNFVVKKNCLILNFKNFILFSKLETLYHLLNNTSQLYFNLFLTGSFNKKTLIYILKKILVNI